jgi:NAD dependent epimerase/dehydratase family enzyme
LFIKDRENLSGVFNCSAPNPVNNKTLMQKLRQYLKIKVGLPSPKWLLEFGAIFIKTETELVLKSRWVLPERLLNAGYNY